MSAAWQPGHIKQLGAMMKAARGSVTPRLSAAAMASALGVIRQTVLRWENDKNTPPLDKLTTYCERLTRRGLDPLKASAIIQHAYPNDRIRMVISGPDRRTTDASARAPQIVTVADIGSTSEVQEERGGNLRLRPARQDDACTLFTTLREAVGGELNGDNDISTQETFERWLSTRKVHFCIAEAWRDSLQPPKAKGFYSIFPLTVRAYEDLKGGALHHDDIGTEHLVDGVFGTTTHRSSDKTVLFVLDVEIIRWGIERKAAVYLTIDLIEKIYRASLRSSVVAVSALIATKSGMSWWKNIGFGRGSKRYAYCRLDHSDWFLYEIGANNLSKTYNDLGKLGWPDMSKLSYPYMIDSQLQKARRALNQLVTRRSP
jgi:transcriptional regulator with XRE-family HTH domain